MQNVVDSDETTFGSISLNAGVDAAGSISVKEINQNFPGGYFAGFEISNSILVGVELLAGLRIRTYQDGNLQENVTGNNLILGVPLLSSSGRQTVGFVTSDPFDEIRISVDQSLASVDLGITDVYHAVVKQFCAGTFECGQTEFLNNPDYPIAVNPERTGLTGLACAACSVANAGDAISESNTDYATLTTTVTAGAQVSLSVRNTLNDFPSGSFAGFVIENVDGFLNAELFDALQVCTYNDGNPQECIESDNDLLRISLQTPLFGSFSSDQYSVGFETTQAFDEIQISYGALVSANALNGALRVYGAFVENYENGEGASCPSIEITLTQQSCYRMLSSPVIGLTYQEMLDDLWVQGVPNSDHPPSEFSNIYSWPVSAVDNSESNWQELNDPGAGLAAEIPSGTGFLISIFEDDDYEASGIQGGFDKTISIPPGPQAAVTLQGSDINQNGDGWTLAGNPLQSNISISDLDTNDLTGAFYVYNINAGGMTNGIPGGWVSNAGGYGDLVDDAIAVGQGFFVQNISSPSGPLLTIPETATTTDGQFYGKQQEGLRNYMRLEMTGADTYSSAWVRFSEEGSYNQVYGDAVQLTPFSDDYAILASKKGGNLMDIGHYPLTANTDSIEIPVHATSTKSGSYTITNTEMDLPADMTLYLKDLQTGESVEITEDFEYSFEINQVAAKQSSPDRATSCSDIHKKPTQAKATPTGARFMITSSVTNQQTDIPSDYKLEQNYPNPFNPTTNIRYQLPQQADVSLQIFDITGRHIATLVDGIMPAGSHTVNYNASTLSSGIYFYKLHAEGINLTRKFTLIK